jgi:hypothetical protein
MKIEKTSRNKYNQSCFWPSEWILVDIVPALGWVCRFSDSAALRWLLVWIVERTIFSAFYFSAFFIFLHLPFLILVFSTFSHISAMY